jgi:alpha-glucosidase
MTRSYPTTPAPPWWQTGVVYQVYPRSFQDSNGDGIGDLRGIAARLDYLEWLGIDAIWISPIFRSPMADFGYDVADYRDVDPIFGNLSDLDELIAAAHRRHIRVLLDFVPNHTSSEHKWFRASRASRTNPKRAWYIWRDPLPDGRPPNSWQANFGGSAWEWDETTGQFYFHSFLKEQPDLDWTNPAVRAAMQDVLRFWFERGIDGFRIDVVNLIAKHRELLPDPVGVSNPRQVWGDERRVHELIGGLRSVAEEFGDRVLIGETWLSLRKLMAYYGAETGGLHLPFNFQLLLVKWSASSVLRAVSRYEDLLPRGAWPNWVLGNHDRPRIATRVGNEQARVAAMLLLTLRGTPTIYYGDELGMANLEIPVDQQQDPARLGPEGSRDPERTPMRWDSTDRSGFTTGIPWLPIGEDFATANVAAERQDPRSMLSLYRALLALRRREAALVTGNWSAAAAPRGVLAYTRTLGTATMYVALNFTGRQARVALPRAGSIRVSTHLDRDGERAETTLTLRPNEGVALKLSRGARPPTMAA